MTPKWHTYLWKNIYERAIYILLAMKILYPCCQATFHNLQCITPSLCKFYFRMPQHYHTLCFIIFNILKKSMNCHLWQTKCTGNICHLQTTLLALLHYLHLTNIYFNIQSIGSTLIAAFSNSFKICRHGYNNNMQNKK